ncbi:MAG: Gfo/Idh/MocA family oxidoreductase [Maribacter sp.]|nr:Gfo/Idh/MocA family oxidoreductase [Maribacter sp.]
MSQPVRWGIVGPGRIAHSFAKDLKLIPGGALTAVGSRNRANAEAFAKEYGAEHSFGSYDALFRSDTVDAIYIATPHTSHAELSIRAMNHGKHVLCEKPMGINRTEVEQMLETAARNKVFLMEALWSRFNPTIKKAKQLITEGAIGKIRYLYADFAFYALDRDEGGRLLNPDLGGGSILDIGIYPIFLSYLILGMPKKIQASSKIYKTGAEVQTAMLFDYQEAQALLYSGLTSKSSMKAEISGSEGSIFIHPRWHESQGYSIEKEGDIASFELPTNGKGYSYEIEEVHDCLKKGELQSDFWSHQNSLDLVKLMDAVRAKSDITFPFEK